MMHYSAKSLTVISTINHTGFILADNRVLLSLGAGNFSLYEDLESMLDFLEVFEKDVTIHNHDSLTISFEDLVNGDSRDILKTGKTCLTGKEQEHALFYTDWRFIAMQNGIIWHCCGPTSELEDGTEVAGDHGHYLLADQEIPAREVHTIAECEKGTYQKASWTPDVQKQCIGCWDASEEAKYQQDEAAAE